MKKPKLADCLLIALLVLIIAWLTFLPGKGKGRDVPVDPVHQSIYQGAKAGRTQAETEILCMTCHGKSSNPLPQAHPPKEQCLICHLLA